MTYMAVDALARLVVCLVVHGGGQALLTRLLAVTVGCIKVRGGRQSLFLLFETK